MPERRIAPWYPTAAYLYVLHLDPPALAWEYLRRHPDYRRDWLRRRRRSEAAQRWGLRLLENPDLDARDAHPVWCADANGVVQLHADVDPPPLAQGFAFWRLPGRKELFHDGRHLLLVIGWPGQRLRLVFAPDLADGTAYVYALRAGARRIGHRAFAAALEALALPVDATPAGVARQRPTAPELLELHTLQALDAGLAGASLREVAEALFGADAVAREWHADGALRARVRRLARRGRTLMRGGYRRLAQLPPLAQGRSRIPAKRP